MSTVVLAKAVKESGAAPARPVPAPAKARKRKRPLESVVLEFNTFGKSLAAVTVPMGGGCPFSRNVPVVSPM